MSKMRRLAAKLSVGASATLIFTISACIKASRFPVPVSVTCANQPEVTKFAPWAYRPRWLPRFVTVWRGAGWKYQGRPAVPVLLSGNVIVRPNYRFPHPLHAPRFSTPAAACAYCLANPESPNATGSGLMGPDGSALQLQRRRAAGIAHALGT